MAQATELVTDPAGHAAVLGTVLWTGVGTTAGCALVEAAALGELSSADATVVFATEPLWGAAFAFLLLGETMGPQCQLGGLLMVLACIVSSTEGDVRDLIRDLGRSVSRSVSSSLNSSLNSGISPAALRLSARTALRAAGGGVRSAHVTASGSLSWAVETMGLAMGCSMGRGRSDNPTRSRALARANMRMLGGARKKR